MQEVKRDHLNLAQIAKRQNIPYCKLYHVYLMIGSIPDAIEVCRKSRKHLSILYMPSKKYHIYCDWTCNKSKDYTACI